MLHCGKKYKYLITEVLWIMSSTKPFAKWLNLLMGSLSNILCIESVYISIIARISSKALYHQLQAGGNIYWISISSISVTHTLYWPWNIWPMLSLVLFGNLNSFLTHVLFFFSYMFSNIMVICCWIFFCARVFALINYQQQWGGSWPTDCPSITGCMV